MNKLKAIGFWKENYGNNQYPNPKTLVGNKWNKETKENVVKYLKSGKGISTWLGYSWCRFNCGISNQKMGDKDLTDGYWLWPEGLVHYVEFHNIMLPDEFLYYISTNQYIINPFDVNYFSQERTASVEFWLQWYFNYLSLLPWYKQLFFYFKY